MRAHLPNEVRLPVVSSKISPSLRPSTAYVMVMLAQPVPGEVLQSTMVYVCMYVCMYVYLRVYIRCMLYVLYVLCMCVSTNVSTKSSFTISLLEFDSRPSILEDDIVPYISSPRLWWTVCAGLVPR